MTATHKQGTLGGARWVGHKAFPAQIRLRLPSRHAQALGDSAFPPALSAVLASAAPLFLGCLHRRTGCRTYAKTASTAAAFTGAKEES